MDADSASASPSRPTLKRLAAAIANEKLKLIDHGDEDDVDDQDAVPGREDHHAPAGKRTSKALAKAGANWSELKRWKKGAKPLGRFPLEVLDLIINIDADLDLRDHLALAGTCRYFRTCYRDVIFQVLFESRYPGIEVPPEHIRVDNEGPHAQKRTRHIGRLFYKVTISGPHIRSWNEARHIFASSKLARDGWGVPNDQWIGSVAEFAQDQDTADFADFLRGERERKVRKLNSDCPPDQRGDFEWQKAELEELAAVDFDIFGDRVRHADYPDPSEEPLVNLSTRKSYVGTDFGARDPWASPWRYLVAEVVNTPTVFRTEAKSKYKLTSQNLMSLKERQGPRSGFFLAAIEALCLRVHGGADGHRAHVDKANARSEKAKQARAEKEALKYGGRSSNEVRKK